MTFGGIRQLMTGGIYLDIDMDYFVQPIQKASVDNLRLFHEEDCALLPTAPVIDKLKASGLSWDIRNVHCFTNHKKSYTYWWISKKQGNTVIHIDAHSDLYRNGSRDLRLLPNSELGCYNYLWYAIRDGYADEIYWVLPESLHHLIKLEEAGRIVHPSIIGEACLDDGGLHIKMACIDIAGTVRQILLHVCEIRQLPYFGRSCEKVTIATSPEFIPAKADDLVFELLDGFGVDRSVSLNVHKQHLDMLSATPEALEAARKKLEDIARNERHK